MQVPTSLSAEKTKRNHDSHVQTQHKLRQARRTRQLHTHKLSICIFTSSHPPRSMGTRRGACGFPKAPNLCQLQCFEANGGNAEVCASKAGSLPDGTNNGAILKETRAQAVRNRGTLNQMVTKEQRLAVNFPHWFPKGKAARVCLKLNSNIMLQ